MTQEEERLVRVEWEGPLTLDQALNKKGDNDYGLYQVYGHHVVFGFNSLLYVGSAREQTFGTRLNNRFYLVNEVTIRLGRIAQGFYSDHTDWMDLVRDVEALTIWWHSPPYNSQNIVSYRGKHIRVQSWEARGSLLPEYSYRWPTHPDTPSRPTDE